MDNIFVSVDGNTPTEDGMISYASWQNPVLLKALREVFEIKPNEKLLGFVINKNGVKASITYVK